MHHRPPSLADEAVTDGAPVPAAAACLRWLTSAFAAPHATPRPRRPARDPRLEPVPIDLLVLMHLRGATREPRPH